MNKCYIEKAKDYLLPALRQYKHNDGTDGFVAGFDYDETIELMANMIEVAKLLSENERDENDRLGPDTTQPKQCTNAGAIQSYYR